MFSTKSCLRSVSLFSQAIVNLNYIVNKKQRIFVILSIYRLFFQNQIKSNQTCKINSVM